MSLKASDLLPDGIHYSKVPCRTGTFTRSGWLVYSSDNDGFLRITDEGNNYVWTSDNLELCVHLLLAHSIKGKGINYRNVSNVQTKSWGLLSVINDHEPIILTNYRWVGKNCQEIIPNFLCTISYVNFREYMDVSISESME